MKTINNIAIYFNNVFWEVSMQNVGNHQNADLTFLDKTQIQ